MVIRTTTTTVITTDSKSGSFTTSDMIEQHKNEMKKKNNNEKKMVRFIVEKKEDKDKQESQKDITSGLRTQRVYSDPGEGSLYRQHRQPPAEALGAKLPTGTLHRRVSGCFEATWAPESNICSLHTRILLKNGFSQQYLDAPGTLNDQTVNERRSS